MMFDFLSKNISKDKTADEIFQEFRWSVNEEDVGSEIAKKHNNELEKALVQMEETFVERKKLAEKLEEIEGKFKEMEEIIED